MGFDVLQQKVLIAFLDELDTLLFRSQSRKIVDLRLLQPE